jgi:hypothetical protein
LGPRRAPSLRQRPTRHPPRPCLAPAQARLLLELSQLQEARLAAVRAQRAAVLGKLQALASGAGAGAAACAAPPTQPGPPAAGREPRGGGGDGGGRGRGPGVECQLALLEALEENLAAERWLLQLFVATLMNVYSPPQLTRVRGTERRAGRGRGGGGRRRGACVAPGPLGPWLPDPGVNAPPPHAP